LYNKLSQMRENNFNVDTKEITKKIDILEDKLSRKKAELHNTQLYIKLFSQKLCTQIFIFDKILVSDTIFFTNFIQLVDGASSNFENGEINLSYDELQHYSLEDMYVNDEYQLYTVFHSVYH